MKLGRHRAAVGYWGRRAEALPRMTQAGPRIRVLLEDKLLAMGRPAALWLRVPADVGMPCTCVKDTSSGAETKCRSCYGSGRAPGMLRFQHETLWASSADIDAGTPGYVLTDCTLDRTLKPYRVALDAGMLTGTIETPTFTYTNPRNAPWETELQAYRRAPNQTKALEFRWNGGAWQPIAALAATGTGTLAFRVTLGRADALDESPTFEILRVRHARPEDRTSRILRGRPELAAGSILMLKTWVLEDAVRDVARGLTAEHGADRSWTAPLDLFSRSIAYGSLDARLQDTGPGPHHMWAPGEGLDTDERYAINKIAYNDQLRLFTYQHFDERRTQEGEIYGQVF